MVESFDTITLSGLARNGWIQRRIHNHLGLLKRRQLAIVAQKLKEAHVPRQIRFADPPQHPQVRLEQRQQAFRPVLMHVTARLFLLRVVDVLVQVARQRPIAAGGIGQESATPLHGDVGRCLHRLDGKVPHGVDHDASLPADPGDDGRPILVVMAPPRLTLLTATPRRAPGIVEPAASEPSRNGR